MILIKIGVVIMILCGLSCPIYEWFKSLFLMVTCLLHGGNWKYYRDYVLLGLLFAGFIVGIVLVVYGAWQIER